MCKSVLRTIPQFWGRHLDFFRPDSSGVACPPVKEILVGLAVGVAAGMLSGMFGIGGGLLIVPALVLLLSLDLQTAIGSSLAALLAPVGILAVWNYHSAGKVNWPAAAAIAVAYLAAAWLGSRLSLSLDESVVRRALAVFLVLVAIYLWFKPDLAAR